MNKFGGTVWGREVGETKKLIVLGGVFNYFSPAIPIGDCGNYLCFLLFPLQLNAGALINAGALMQEH